MGNHISHTQIGKTDTPKTDTPKTDTPKTDSPTKTLPRQLSHNETPQTDTDDTDTIKRPKDQCKNGMEEDLPIIVDGHTVARAIIKHDKIQATKSASAAASHVSTPSDIQICTFSDGSHSRECRGGVALAYRTPWLPQGWEQGWGAKGEATDISGDFVRKAWPYGYAATSMVMEGVGVLESLCAANEELEQHLPVLLKHSSTVNVRATTDCQAILKYISTGILTTNQAKTFPLQFIEKIHDLILALQGHGIRVFVELHWCPRNMVPQLEAADAMAGRARSSGFGFCNVTKNLWTKPTQSAIMKELEPMLAGLVRFDRLLVSHISTGGGSTGKTDKQTTKKARRGKKAAKRAQSTNATSTGTAASHPQLPLPSAPLPSKPTPSKPITTSTAGDTASNDGQATSNAEPTTIPSTKPTATAAAAQPTPQTPEEPAKVQVGKRKAEEEAVEKSEERPTKKAKPSPADPPEQEQQPPPMPAAWGMDSQTDVYVNNPQTGEVTEETIERAPWLRTKPESTKQTGEKNVFISDGVSPFCLAKPVGITIQP